MSLPPFEIPVSRHLRTDFVELMYVMVSLLSTPMHVCQQIRQHTL